MAFGGYRQFYGFGRTEGFRLGTMMIPSRNLGHIRLCPKPIWLCHERCSIHSMSGMTCFLTHKPDSTHAAFAHA
jgi:hypothetical protein